MGGLEEEEGHSSCWEKVQGLHNTGLQIREVSKGSSRKKLKIKIRPKQIEQESSGLAFGHGGRRASDRNERASEYWAKME